MDADRIVDLIREAFMEDYEGRSPMNAMGEDPDFYLPEHLVAAAAMYRKKLEQAGPVPVPKGVTGKVHSRHWNSPEK